MIAITQQNTIVEYFTAASPEQVLSCSSFCNFHSPKIHYSIYSVYNVTLQKVVPGIQATVASHMHIWPFNRTILGLFEATQQGSLTIRNGSHFTFSQKSESHHRSRSHFATPMMVLYRK